MIDYKTLAKTNIFNAVIAICGKKDIIYYHKYKPDVAINITDKSMDLYAINVITNSWKKKPFKKINYSRIENVVISICRRNYGSIAAIIINEYHLDITINLKNFDSYQLETQSWNNFIEMIDKLKLENITIIDELNVYKSYIKDKKKYIENLDVIYDELADTYKLNHYRAGNKR